MHSSSLPMFLCRQIWCQNVENIFVFLHLFCASFLYRWMLSNMLSLLRKLQWFSCIILQLFCLCSPLYSFLNSQIWSKHFQFQLFLFAIFCSSRSFLFYYSNRGDFSVSPIESFETWKTLLLCLISVVPKNKHIRLLADNAYSSIVKLRILLFVVLLNYWETRKKIMNYSFFSISYKNLFIDTEMWIVFLFLQTQNCRKQIRIRNQSILMNLNRCKTKCRHKNGTIISFPATFDYHESEKNVIRTLLYKSHSRICRT